MVIRVSDMESRGEKEYATEVQQLTKNRYISTERSALDIRAVTFRKNISRFPWLWSPENNRFATCMCVVYVWVWVWMIGGRDRVYCSADTERWRMIVAPGREYLSNTPAEDAYSCGQNAATGKEISGGSSAELLAGYKVTRQRESRLVTRDVVGLVPRWLLL